MRASVGRAVPFTGAPAPRGRCPDMPGVDLRACTAHPAARFAGCVGLAALWLFAFPLLHWLCLAADALIERLLP